MIPLGYPAARLIGVPAPERRLYAASLFLILAASTLVWDVSRSICFAFPILLLALSWMQRAGPPETMRWLLISFGLCVMTPAFYLAPGGLQLYLPAIAVALRITTGWDIVDLIRTRGAGTFGVH